MGKKLLEITAFVILALMVPEYSLANDPPHNDDSGVSCGECHGESLFATDPATMTPAELKDAYNGMCKRCHTSVSGSYHATSAPAADAHSSAVILGNYTFTTSCIDCHHPHYQDQFWFGRKYYKSDYEIAYGTGSAAPHPTEPNRSVITYTSLALKSGWTVAELGAKTSDGRGAMLLPNRASPYNSRIIEAITGDQSSGTITVKGPVSSIGATGFAIAYGQAIKRDIPYLIDDTTPIPEPVVFLDNKSGWSYAVNDRQGAGETDSTPTGICQVCHTRTNHWRNDGTVSLDGTHRTYSGTNCMVCHYHENGVKAECDTCHGYAPGQLGQPPDHTGSTTAGAHATHVNTKGYSCDFCHWNSYGKASTHNNGDKQITMGFSLFGGDYRGGSYDGQDTAQYNATTTNPVTSVANTGTRTCSGLYCHGTLPGGANWGGGTNRTPVWDGTVACGDCHRATAASPPTSGQHQKHAKAFNSGYNYDCGFCHQDPTVDGSLHGNNKSEVIFSNDPKVSGGTYNGDTDMLGSYGTCENIYCHSTIQSSPPGSDPTYRTTPAWNGSFGGCDKCHYTWGSNPGLETGSHDPHFFNDEGQQCYGCHNWEVDDDPCFACHGDGDFFSLRQVHANHEINVMFSPKYSGSYSGSLTPGDAYGSCSNVYCHGNYNGSGLNATPTWGDPPTAACGTCHGSANNNVPASGTHAKHAGNDRIFNAGEGIWTNQMNIACTVCHEDIIDGTGPASYTIQSRTKHVNMQVDWKFDTSDIRISGSESYSEASEGQLPSDGDTGAGHRAYGTCSNIYCHSNVQPDGGVGPPTIYTTPANLKWGTTTACFGCHAGETGTYTSRHSNIHTGSHDAHVSSTNCKICHNWFYPAEIAGTCGSCHPGSVPNLEASRHVNGSVDILFQNSTAGPGAAYNGTPQPGDGYSTCSNVFCHSDGTPLRSGDTSYTNSTPPWGGTIEGCNTCHGNGVYPSPRDGMPNYANYSDGGPKENSHKEHMVDLAIPGNMIGCEFCHWYTTEDGTSIANAAYHGNVFYNIWGPTTNKQFLNRDVWIRQYYTPPVMNPSIPATLKYGGSCREISCHGSIYPDATYMVESYVTHWGHYQQCGDCHIQKAVTSKGGIVGQGDIESYTVGDGSHAMIDGDQWRYSGHGRESTTYDVSGNPAADFTGAANCASPAEQGCDPCLYCHDESEAHDWENDSTNPFRLRDHGGSNGWNDVCLVCHGTGATGYDPDGAGVMNNKSATLFIDKYHSGYLHGDTNDGGSLCWDCHDPHGDRTADSDSGGNIFMIHEQVVKDKADEYGAPSPGGAVSVVFTNNAEESDFAKSAAPFNGLCNVCHASADHYTDSGGDGHFAPGTRACTNCHLHSINTNIDGSAFDHAGGGSCEECHGHDAGTNYDPDLSSPYTAGTTPSQGSGTFQSHSTHTETDADDVKGPGLYCDDCHDITELPYFKSGSGTAPYDLSNTDVCDGCHSSGGPYDGIDDTVLGAKTNWKNGVYSGNVLAAGKERWCVTCHDSGVSVINGRQAPDVAGNNTSWGYYVSGHGSADAAQECSECHGLSMDHSFDGIRTYRHVSDNYKYGFRLKDVSGGDPLNIPNTASGCGYVSNDFILCWQCHNERALLDSPLAGGIYCANPFPQSPFQTAFRNELAAGDEAIGEHIPSNIHIDHLNDINSYFGTDWRSDGVTSNESRTSCPACHNIHGAQFDPVADTGVPTLKMTRSEYKLTYDTDGNGDYGQIGPGNTWNACAALCHGWEGPFRYYRPQP